MLLSDLNTLQDQLQNQDFNPQSIRALINQGRDSMFDAFDNDVSISLIIKQYSNYIDTILSACFQHYLSSNQLNFCSLVAVGGYGRQELLPSSDIDLMILLKDEPDKELEAGLSQFLTVLWDFGLEIGHSVRTIKDCVAQGKDDITVITNMIESRIITGSHSLYDDFQKAIATDQIWSSRAFFEAKLQELKTRHAKYNNTAYNLEPNIKEGPGGLRDIQIIGWVAKRHFKVDTLKQLIDHKFLTEDEFNTLNEGQELLWKIRFALHRLNNRREDQLLFDHQNNLSIEFGYESGPNNLSIEQFMQTYYRTIMELERLSEMLLQLFQEEILFSETHDAGTELSENFIMRNGFIEAAHENIFKDQPSALLEIFLILQRYNESGGVHASTIRLIRENLYLIDDSFRQNPKINVLFLNFMRNQQGVTHQLRRMNSYGVLAAYIPAFEMIVGRMQYDLYHAYTVDTHTLFVIRNMRRFASKEFHHEFPLCSEIHLKQKKPELLFLAGLFHDIAKGRGGDHAELGAKDALQFCLMHKMNRADAKIVSTLVRLHLSMSMTAQKKDTSDPEVILEFAELVGDSDMLDYLYLLTVSDMRATNPSLWNNWKDALLKDLYRNTKHVLDNPDQIIQSDNKRAEIKREKLSKMAQEMNLDSDKVNHYFSHMPQEYFLYHQKDEVLWHLENIIGELEQTHILIRYSERNNTTEVLIYTLANKHVIYRASTAFDNLGIDVLDAQILLSNHNYVINTFMIQEHNGDKLINENRIQQIQAELEKSLDKNNTVVRNTQHHIPRQLKSFELITEIEFIQDYPNQKTVLEITTIDRPGLLSVITQVLEKNEIDINSAKITTLGEKVNDIFTCTNSQNEIISDEQILNELKDKLENGIASIH